MKKTLIFKLGIIAIGVLVVSGAWAGGYLRWPGSTRWPDSPPTEQYRLVQLTVGEMQTNCYILGSKQTGAGLIIDPGAEPARILAKVAELGLQVKYIVLTHGHIDHIGALTEIRQATGAPVLIQAEDAPMLTEASKNLSQQFGQSQTFAPAEQLLKAGAILELGELKLKVLHTPGHTPGSISLLSEGKIFSGDTLFKSGVGRTDFPGGSQEELSKSLKEQLLPLPETTEVYPGHGPTTTIGAERLLN